MEQIKEANVHNTAGETQIQKNSRKAGWIAGAVLVLIIAAYLGICAYANSLQTFYPNYHINGIDVGGLTVEAAQAALEEQIPAQSITLIDVQTQEELTAITVSDLGYTAQSFAGDAQAWMDDMNRDGFLQKGWTFLCVLTGTYPGGWHWPDPDQNTFSDTVADLSRRLSQDALHGTYALQDESIVITRAKDGRSIDAAALECLRDISAYQGTYRVELSFETIPGKALTAQEIYAEVSGEMRNAGYDAATDSITPEKVSAEFDAASAQAALDLAQPGESISVPAQVQLPAVTAAELESLLFRDVLGEARTWVSGTAARKANVRLSAASINGYVMNTGDVFSYNGVVGQRTAANGYQPAPAYVKGETVDEIGGGICQTSSTLYLACLRGNLEITERYAHRFVPSYIPWGMDATVSWGGPDYKFTNDTNYPIKIVTEYKNNYLTVKVLGTNVTGNTSRMTNVTLSSTPWVTVYEEDETIAPGTQTVKTTPYTGYKVQTYHTIYAPGGSVIDRHFEATSDYKVRNQVILVAPGEIPGSTPSVPAAGDGDGAITTDPADSGEAETDVPAEEPEKTPEETETPIVVIPDLNEEVTVDSQ